MSKLAAALAFLALNFYVYQYWATEEVIPQREGFEDFPLVLDEWRCPGSREMEPEVMRFLGATDYLLCDYQRSEAPVPVELYVGYHASQVRREGGGGNAHSIHPPEHCLPGGGWDIINARRVPIGFPGLPAAYGLLDRQATAKRFVIAKGEERRLVYFWYQGQGRVVTANEDVILTRFWNRATKGRTDGALVRFTTPIVRDDVPAAEERVDDLASRVVPLLSRYVPE